MSLGNKNTNDFLAAYASGQRYFTGLEMDEEKIETAGLVLRDATFEHCFMFLDFNGADLTNTRFISCNIKTADFRNAIMTNALIKNCSVESTMFKGAKTDGLVFEENYCYSATVGQEAFIQHFKDAGPNE